MNEYVIVYNRLSGEVVERSEFDQKGQERALAFRFELERIYKEQSDIEIVVLSANSWDDLLLTHARYFKSLEELTSSIG